MIQNPNVNFYPLVYICFVDFIDFISLHLFSSKTLAKVYIQNMMNKDMRTPVIKKEKARFVLTFLHNFRKRKLLFKLVYFRVYTKTCSCPLLIPNAFFIAIHQNTLFVLLRIVCEIVSPLKGFHFANF